MRKAIQNGLWFNIICGIFVFGLALILLFFGSSAKACEFDLGCGIAFIDDQNGYYMPAEIVEIDQNGVLFRGSNGMTYEWNSGDSIWQISDDFQYLLMMDSKGSHYWWDDEILVVWRA